MGLIWRHCSQLISFGGSLGPYECDAIDRAVGKYTTILFGMVVMSRLCSKAVNQIYSYTV
jgi:hypothetical protein